jgi:hypothetical protein
VPSSARTSACTAADARTRLKTALAYLEVADLVLGEKERDEYLDVAAGLAVLAGIAASDSICCADLRCRRWFDPSRSHPLAVPCQAGPCWCLSHADGASCPHSAPE